MMTLLLPYPPSVNRLWRFSKRGMYRTKEYGEWADEASRILRSQTTPEKPIDYPIAMELAVGRPDKRKRDIDNVNKAVLDLLEAIEVVENDHYIHDLRSYWSDEVSGVQVMIKDYEESKQSRLLTN